MQVFLAFFRLCLPSIAQSKKGEIERIYQGTVDQLGSGKFPLPNSDRRCWAGRGWKTVGCQNNVRSNSYLSGVKSMEFFLWKMWCTEYPWLVLFLGLASRRWFTKLSLISRRCSPYIIFRAADECAERQTCKTIHSFRKWPFLTRPDGAPRNQCKHWNRRLWPPYVDWEDQETGQNSGVTRVSSHLKRILSFVAFSTLDHERICFYGR